MYTDQQKVKSFLMKHEKKKVEGYLFYEFFVDVFVTQLWYIQVLFFIISF